MSYDTKYSARNFAEFRGNKPVAELVQSMIMRDALPYVLGFWGPHGVGKDTLSKLIVRAVLCEHRKNNSTKPCPKCSTISLQSLVGCEYYDCTSLSVEDVKGILRGMIFASPFIRYYIFNEFTELSCKVQQMFREPVTKFTNTHRFVFCFNDKSKLDSGMESRIELFRLAPPSDNELFEHMDFIRKKEKLNVEDFVLLHGIKRGVADYRASCQFMEVLANLSQSKKNIQIADVEPFLSH